MICKRRQAYLQSSSHWWVICICNNKFSQDDIIPKLPLLSCSNRLGKFRFLSPKQSFLILFGKTASNKSKGHMLILPFLTTSNSYNVRIWLYLQYNIAFLDIAISCCQTILRNFLYKYMAGQSKTIFWNNIFNVFSVKIAEHLSRV